MKKYSKILSNGLDVPSHSELLRDFHNLEKKFIKFIEFLFSDDEKTTSGLPEYEIEYEVEGWDIVITKFSSNDSEEQNYIKKFGGLKYGIEYKSSIEEWGKQFDAYIRQIKARVAKKVPCIPILVSFDKRIEDYVVAGERSGFLVIYLPEEALKDLKGEPQLNKV